MFGLKWYITPCLSIYQSASFFGAMSSSSTTEVNEAGEEVVHVIFECGLLHEDMLLGGEQDEAEMEELGPRWRRSAYAAARTNHMLGFLPVSVLRVWFVHWVGIYDCQLLRRDFGLDVWLTDGLMFD
jgi:hypothetical protein